MAARERTVQIKFRMNEEEAQILKDNVDASGMSQQEYLLSRALDQTIVNTNGVKEIVPQLRAIGNNLNQIAKALNETKYYDYKLITQNQKELEEIWRQLKQLVRSKV